MTSFRDADRTVAEGEKREQQNISTSEKKKKMISRKAKTGEHGMRGESQSLNGDSGNEVLPDS
jgi:hypothetical protein